MARLDDNPWLLWLIAGGIALGGSGIGSVAAVTTFADARDFGGIVADVRHLQEEQTKLRSSYEGLRTAVSDTRAYCASNDALINLDKSLRQLAITQRIGADNRASEQAERLREHLATIGNLQDRLHAVEQRVRGGEILYEYIKAKEAKP